MPPSDDYSEKEMALILKRAAELQEGSDGQGVQRSLAQIQEIAAEAGIEPAYVAEAAAELERPVPRVGWLGAPTRFHEERSVPGALSPNDLGDLLDRARAELGLHGEVHQVFDGVEWRARSALGAAILTIGPRAGGIRIALTTERIDQAVAIASGSVAIGLLSALGGVAIAINVTNNAVVASAIVAASAIAGTVVSARALWHGVAERWRRKTRSVVEGLASRASQLRQTTLNNEKSLSRGG
jgi:hypothetical protein